MKKNKCYIYTRVSTSMQVDGYSLDAQKDKLRKYAEFQDMLVVGEYSDEGKSGKNINGRPDFQKMIEDIKMDKDKVDYVLVFKLSRFGRNAADVLNSLQIMQDYGVNLICVEDGIDSSKDSGKLMISVLSAVAEIERDNILVQTMEGRKQKAREGRWNGGFAPYGYELVNGELKIAEDEAEVIRAIYDQFIHTNSGVTTIAKYLNRHGYIKKKRQNGSLDTFSANFVKKVLDNPVYCGKIAYGRRKTEKVNGERNQFHIVKQDEYPIYQGIHEAIISESDWNLAHKKRLETGKQNKKIYSLEHKHILSGIVCCPVCGYPMYGSVNRKKKKDGTFYKDVFYYACKHRLEVDGHKCDYKKQIHQDKLNNSVEEILFKMVCNPKFKSAITEKLRSKIDIDELQSQMNTLKKEIKRLYALKDKIGEQIDSLDVFEAMYDKKFEDLQARLNSSYLKIEETENECEELQKRIDDVLKNQISEEKVYEFLYLFDIMYKEFTDAEKKEFMNSFIERIEIYPEPLSHERILKSIKFKFPVSFDKEEFSELFPDEKITPETGVLLSQRRADEYINIKLDLTELDITSAESKPTYNEIKNYVLKEYGLKVTTLNIAQVKSECGIIERENYNKGKPNHKVPECTMEKREVIKKAFKHFKLI